MRAILFASATMALLRCTRWTSRLSHPKGMLVEIEVQQAGPSAVDHQLPHIRTAAFADAQENRSAAGRVLPQYEAEPGGETARPFELPAIADSGD